MPIIGLLLTLFAVSAAWFGFEQTHQRAVVEAAEVSAQAGSLMVYRNYVATYAEANPSASGSVADTALSLPTWYQKTPNAGNYLQAGTRYVYLTSPLPGVVGSLAQRTESITVGINNAGYLTSPRAGQTGIPVPAQVPLGALVIVQ
jgi:hypothetical protein